MNNIKKLQEVVDENNDFFNSIFPIYNKKQEETLHLYKLECLYEDLLELELITPKQYKKLRLKKLHLSYQNMLKNSKNKKLTLLTIYNNILESQGLDIQVINLDESGKNE
jgi:hypothetical protein